MVEIIKNLYLCSWPEAQELVPKLVTPLVINCTKNLDFLCLDTQRIPINDHREQEDTLFLNGVIKEITDMIHNNLTEKTHVVVHCQAGRQRSAAVIAGYLMKYHGYSLENVIEFIRSKKREAFFPEVNFLDTLKFI